MPVVQKFSYRQADGTIIPHDSDRIYYNFANWLNGLPEEDQIEYKKADIRQKLLRQEVIDQGNLTIAPGGTRYVWKDEHACDSGKPTDPVWFDYWRRYMSETKQEIIVIYENV
jgi:hypothetical protein